MSIYEKHHILPKSFKLGGQKDLENIVKLTPKEHFIVHHLLSKMFIGEYKKKMNYAFWSMCQFITTDRLTISSRFYNSARCAFIKTHSEFKHSIESKQKMSKSRKGTMTGSKNSMYGRRGINHPRYGKPGMTGSKNPQYGKPGTMLGRRHSEESKIKNSISNSTIENINKRRNANRKRWTESARNTHKQNMLGSGNYNAASWSITEITTSRQILIDDLKLFCITHNLRYNYATSASRTNKPYNGYIFKKVQK